MRTEKVKLTQVLENKSNPRTITESSLDKLVKSLLVFPQMLELRPIVVDDTMTVLGGNMRLRALNKIVGITDEEIRNILMSDTRLQNGQLDTTAEYWKKWQGSPTATICRASNLTEAQRREFVVKDNVGFGEWDMNALQAHWSDLPLADWGLTFEKFTTEEGNTSEENEDTNNNYERKIVPPYI